jgi:hypothetical protein
MTTSNAEIRLRSFSCSIPGNLQDEPAFRAIPDHSPNPYQSPQIEMPMFAPAPAANLRLHKTLKDFRSQILALGVAWIILAGLALAAGVLIGVIGEQPDDATPIVMAVVGVVGLLWGGLGVCACLKQMWAVYTGLVLSYLSVAGNLLQMNLCPIVILVLIIVQAHRVIGFAKELQRAGVPLTTRPEDLDVRQQMPA